MYASSPLSKRFSFKNAGSTKANSSRSWLSCIKKVTEIKSSPLHSLKSQTAAGHYSVWAKSKNKPLRSTQNATKMLKDSKAYRVSLKRPLPPKRHSSKTQQKSEDLNLNHHQLKKWSDLLLRCKLSTRRRREICVNLCVTRTTSSTSSKSYRNTDRTLLINTAAPKYRPRHWPIWQSNRRPIHRANRVLHLYILTLMTNFPKSSMLKASKRHPLTSIESLTIPSNTSTTKSQSQRLTMS